MPRYSFDVRRRNDDDASANLHRIGGAAVGLSTGDWPRHHGRPMQHALTVDLAEVELEIPRAAEARAVSVFVDTYYELDVGGGEGIAVVWLTQEQIDAHPQTKPPADFVAELLPGHETMDEDGEYYETGEPHFELEQLDEDDDDGNFGDSYLGGSPAWGDAGKPELTPNGGFVMQIMNHDFPVCRQNACMFVFEGGAYIQAEDPDDEELPIPWPEAIAASRELVVLDEPPPADALQKWGGLPRGVNSYDWPNRMSHIVTWVPTIKPDYMEGVALALFGRLSKTDNWATGDASYYELLELRQADLDEYDPAEVEVPDGVEVLEERAIELRELPQDTTWRDLQTRCFVGPRPAWRCPDHRSAEQRGERVVLQLTEALLPVSPGRGSLLALGSGYPIWHPAPGTPQASRQRYIPQGTLYADRTTAAIVVGWCLSFSDDSVLPDKIEALEQALLSSLAMRAPNHNLRLYVPGDTTTNRDGDVHGSLVLGRAVVEVEANDYEPGPVNPARLQAALAELPKLDESFWREAVAFTQGMETPEPPDTYLLSWGPLCCGVILAGVAASKDDEHVYSFVANQDMHQEWSTEGVDGVSVGGGVEFSSVTKLELTEQQLARAEKLDKPGFWLICRYD